MPYLVSTDGTGGAEFEIPIRSGNKTRTARRHELMLVLSDQANAPDAEMVNGQIKAFMTSDSEPLGEYPISLSPDIQLEFYAGVFISTAQPITITKHRSKIRFHIPGRDNVNELRIKTWGSPKAPSVGFREIAGGFYFDAPDGFSFQDSFTIPRELSDVLKNATSIPVEIELHVAGRNRPIRVQNELVRQIQNSRKIANVRTEELGTWTWSVP